MNRRDAIKTLALLGFTTITLNPFLNFLIDNKKYHFVGLGDAGAILIDYFNKNGLSGKFSCISNVKPDNLSSEIQFFHFTPPGKNKIPDKHGFYGVYDMNAQLIIPESFKKVFESNNKFILIAGLGGYTGTKMIKNLSALLHNKNKEFYTICTLPFQFEGIKRMKIANKALNEIQKYSKCFYYNLENINQEYNGELMLSQAFNIADDQMYKMFINDMVS